MIFYLTETKAYKCIFILLLFIFNFNYSIGQISEDIPLANDYKYINHKIDSLLKDGVPEIAVLQIDTLFTSLDSCDFNIHSIIFWNKGENGNMQVISCRRIYKNILLKKINCFNYKNRTLTQITKSEFAGLEKPYVVTGNALFYFSKVKSFYFEVPYDGYPDTYASNKKYEKYRLEWYKMFKRYLNNLHINDLPYKSYNRFLIDRSIDK